MTTLLFHINSFLTGGIEKVLLELLWGLDPKQHRIRLSIAHHLDELELLRDQIPPYVEVSYIMSSPMLTNTKKKKILKTASAAEKLFENIILPPFKKRAHVKELKRLMQDADVIIDFDMTLAAYTHLFQGKRKIAYCHFSFMHYWDGNKQKLEKLSRRLARYDKVVMLCDEMKEAAEANYPILKGHLVRIYNALNIDKVKQLAQEPLTDATDILNSGYFLSAGRLEETQKDFTMLIQGYAASVRQYGINEKLVIIGAGPDKQNLEALAQSEGVGNRVIFAGFQQNPYKWMSNCKLFIFCSKFEGLPTVLIEAQSLGCPIIATATPTGVQEILAYGKAGILVPPGAVNDLSEAIHRLHDNTALQNSFRQGAYEILAEFDIQYMVARFEKMVAGQPL